MLDYNEDLNTVTFLLTLVQTENKAVKRFIGLSKPSAIPKSAVPSHSSPLPQS